MCCGSSLHPLRGFTTARCREEPQQAAAKSSSLTRDSSPTAQVCTCFYWMRSWWCRYLSPQELLTLPKSSSQCWQHLVHIYWGKTSHHPLAILSHLWTHRLVACRLKPITASLSWDCCFSRDLPPQQQSPSCLLSLAWARDWGQPWFSHCRTELSSFQIALP